MAEEASLFSEVVGLQQKKFDGGVVFPAVLYPNPNASNPVQLTDAIKANKPWLDSLLHISGAILFRGFPVSTASDFNDVVESSGYEDFSYGSAGTSGTRTNIIGRVYTANEAPPDQRIGFHHEMSFVRLRSKLFDAFEKNLYVCFRINFNPSSSVLQATEFPSKLFFFCEIEPGSGGETCIVLSHVIYEKMKRKHPEFVAQMHEKGLMYIRVLGGEFDASSPVGNSWKATFMTDDKTVAEERANKVGMKLEWVGDSAKKIMGPMPGFIYDKARQRTIWFNGVAVLYGGINDKLNDDPTKAVVFGDGEPLPPNDVHDLLKMLDEECVVLQWQKGDVLLLDNFAVLHARQPLLAPPRRILASFCK